MGQIGLDPCSGFKEIQGISSMLLHACCHRENIGIKHDVLGRESAVDQQMVSPGANVNASLVVVSLARFIKGHDDHRCTIPLHQFSLSKEFLFTGFQRDRVDHRLALHTAQARFNDFPFGGVNHDGNAGNIRL